MSTTQRTHEQHAAGEVTAVVSLANRQGHVQAHRGRGRPTPATQWPWMPCLKGLTCCGTADVFYDTTVAPTRLESLNPTTTHRRVASILRLKSHRRART